MENGIKHILYVDDDPDDHEILKEAFLQIDPTIDIHFYDNPYRALLDLQSSKIMPDLLLVDINMPSMSGFEFCMNAKLLHSPENIPVFFLSTSTHQQDIDKAKVSGGNGYIAKTVTFDELRAAMAYLIGKVNDSHIAPNVQMFI